MQHARHFSSDYTQIDDFGEIHSMKHVDPEHNMHRFYRLRIQPDLFAPASLCIAWGRIGRPERLRIEASGDIQSLKTIASKIADKKLRKGYMPEQ